MKNKTALIIFINGVFLFLLIFSATSAYASPLSFFVDEITIKETTYENNFATKIIHLCTLLLPILIVFAILFLTHTAVLWNKLDFYNQRIMRNLDIMGYAFLGFSVLVYFVIILTPQLDILQTQLVRVTILDIFDGMYLAGIGLFFLLVSTVLSKAKALKEETDLTI